MSFDYDKQLKLLRDWADSEEGQASMRKFAEERHKKQEIAEGRYKRFEEWLKNNDFDELMLRLIHEHGEDYCEKCYHNGYEPYPNRKLAFLIDYLVHNYEPIEVPEIEPEHFPSTIYFFKGYYFQTICGQGCFHRIYNKEDMQMILQV